MDGEVHGYAISERARLVKKFIIFTPPIIILLVYGYAFSVKLCNAYLIGFASLTLYVYITYSCYKNITYKSQNGDTNQYN